MKPLTIGPLHHMSVAVADVEETATTYEKTLGWERTLDFEMGPDDAAKVGRILGIPRLDWAHMIVVAAPGSRVGMIEFVQMRNEDASGLPTGVLALSYRVANADAAIETLVADGFELVCAPEDMFAGGQIRMGTVRGKHPGLIEVVQFLGR